MERPGTLERLREAKWGLLEIVVIAILLAFSVGAYSSLALEWFDKGQVALASTLLFAICIVYISLRHTRDRHLSTTLESTFLIDAENNIVSIPGYQVSEEVENYLSSAFSENPALRRQWDLNPVRTMWGERINRFPRNDHPSAKLIREVYEYTLLEDLGTHLQGYFRNAANRSGNLRTYGRNDLPDVLLANRFLELFSRDMEDRPAFTDSQPPTDGSIVVMQTGPGGYYAHFELTLPEGSTLKRETNGQLAISGPAFQMRLGVEFQGFASNVPFDLLSGFVDVEPLEVSSYEVKVHVDVRVRRSFIFSGRRWNDHLWVDSLISKYEENFSFSGYLERINWPIVSAVLRTWEIRDRQHRTRTPEAPN